MDVKIPQLPRFRVVQPPHHRLPLLGIYVPQPAVPTVFPIRSICGFLQEQIASGRATSVEGGAVIMRIS